MTTRSCEVLLVTGVAAWLLGACGSGAGDEHAAALESALITDPGIHVPVVDGVTVRRPDKVCPGLVVGSFFVAGEPSTEYVEQFLPADAAYLPAILGAAYPNALRSDPLYCVYLSPTDTRDGFSAALANAAAAECGPTCTVSPTYDVSVPRPGGHQCTSCKAD